MTDGEKENVSLFLVLIYAHWSLESMIIWPKQMDREIPQGFSVLHVLTTNGVHMLEEGLVSETAGNISLSIGDISFQ